MKLVKPTAASSRTERFFDGSASAVVLALSLITSACVASSPSESSSSESVLSGNRAFSCDPESGNCYSYVSNDSGGGDPQGDFTLHIGSGFFTPENGYTLLFTLQVNFGPFVGETVRQGSGDSTPLPGHPWTWCEMTVAGGQVLYSRGRTSAAQLQLNLLCECLDLGSCSDDISCRPEGPDEWTPIEDQIAAPACE